MIYYRLFENSVLIKIEIITYCNINNNYFNSLSNAQMCYKTQGYIIYVVILYKYNKSLIFFFYFRIEIYQSTCQ